MIRKIIYQILHCPHRGWWTLRFIMLKMYQLINRLMILQGWIFSHSWCNRLNPQKSGKLLPNNQTVELIKLEEQLIIFKDRFMISDEINANCILTLTLFRMDPSMKVLSPTALLLKTTNLANSKILVPNLEKQTIGKKLSISIWGTIVRLKLRWTNLNTITMSATS